MGALVKKGAHEAVVSVAPMQYLTFMLGSEMFAIDILGIKEIIEYGNLTSVPLMPEFIRGVINLRGAAVPVLDLTTRFARTRSDVSRRTCIVIVEVQGAAGTQEIGIVVDAVSEVIEIAASDIEAAPSFGAKVRSEFIHGMGKIKEKFVIILNMNKVLSMDELSALESIAVDA